MEGTSDKNSTDSYYADSKFSSFFQWINASQNVVCFVKFPEPYKMVLVSLSRLLTVVGREKFANLSVPP